MRAQDVIDAILLTAFLGLAATVVVVAVACTWWPASMFCLELVPPLVRP